MWTQWMTQPSSFARTYDLLNNFRRQMDQALGELEGGRATYGPAVRLDDRGSQLVLSADLPGMTDKDVSITATADGMTVAGERSVEPPSGYSVHRQERPSFKFSRSVSFPVRIDVEKVKAVVANGVLTVTMAKAAEAQPRQISISKS